MREQVITPRATGRGSQSSKASAGGMVQRPARRERGASARQRDASGVRRALSYFPLVGKITLAVVMGLLIFAGYRAAAAASFFQARKVEVNSTSRASADEIKGLVRRAVAQTGVWRADLDAISTELQRLPWVRSAVVSRVLPDGLRVRVTERVPRAVVRTSAGRLVWVDTDAVMLGAMSPTDQMPPFFIRGLEEAETSAARAANRERMQAYEEMRTEWERLGLSERVSEVNLDDLRDVRAQLAGDDSQIEIRLGREDFGNRLNRALLELDNQRNTARGPFIMYIDASQGVAKGSHLVVGLRPDAQVTSTSETASSPNDAEIVKARASERPAPKEKQANRQSVS
ncbi:MAG: FtsQ-type POTRA domain-containing protein, partial [Acidobacteria bacterium]|nr:FtsQ-type POTRA domain-containing protein [Acidobacteriota bacterium]